MYQNIIINFHYYVDTVQCSITSSRYFVLLFSHFATFTLFILIFYWVYLTHEHFLEYMC